MSSQHPQYYREDDIGSPLFHIIFFPKAMIFPSLCHNLIFFPIRKFIHPCFRLELDLDNSAENLEKLQTVLEDAGTFNIKEHNVIIGLLTVSSVSEREN